MWRTNICSFLKYRGLQIREKSQFRITISVLFGWSIFVWCYCIERREITVLPWIHWLSSWSTKFLNGIMLCKIIKNHLVPVQCLTLQHFKTSSTSKFYQNDTKPNDFWYAFTISRLSRTSVWNTATVSTCKMLWKTVQCCHVVLPSMNTSGRKMSF